MADYYEIDLIDVESATGGDAITLRYRIGNYEYIHVVDGGYQDTGEKIVNLINKYYDKPDYIDNVILTHQDNDHAGGLRTVLESFKVGKLWMLRPWIYAEEIIDRFTRYSSVENLKKKLKEVYSNIAVLEEIAEERGIDIGAPFQGQKIGAFSVLSPMKSQYLDLIVDSDKTPDAKDSETVLEKAYSTIKKAISYIKAKWGYEVFPEEGTSRENEMSIIQYAQLCEDRIILTGDAGREALDIAANYAPNVGLYLPGVDKFQVPHHGSRHNLSSRILDKWFGPILPMAPDSSEVKFTAMISASDKDEDHPRKVVVRSLIHRGGSVIQTKGNNIRTQKNAPARPGYYPIQSLTYPEEIEE